MTPTGYQPLLPDARGRLWLEPARTWLAVEDNEIVCYDESDRRLGDYTTLARSLQDIEARLHAVEAELRRLRSDASPDA